MAANNLFSIGNMAKLFHISSGTLRHYETIGLLTPEYIDPETGYRYYSDRQFEPLNTIRYLRMLNIPLPEIADFLQNKDIDLIEKKLCQQKEAIAKRQRELAMIERKIDHRLLQLRNARNSPLNQICVHQKEACRLMNQKIIHIIIPVYLVIRHKSLYRLGRAIAKALSGSGRASNLSRC